MLSTYTMLSTTMVMTRWKATLARSTTTTVVDANVSSSFYHETHGVIAVTVVVMVNVAVTSAYIGVVMGQTASSWDTSQSSNVAQAGRSTSCLLRVVWVNFIFARGLQVVKAPRGS